MSFPKIPNCGVCLRSMDMHVVGGACPTDVHPPSTSASVTYADVTTRDRSTAEALVFCDCMGDLQHSICSTFRGRIAKAIAREREATIDAVLRILNASERDYAWLRQRVRDERAK